MSRSEQLQACIDLLARNHVPALADAKVKSFGAIFEVWDAPQRALVVGSANTIMLWLGCVAVTKCVRSYPNYPPEILWAVVRSAERAGVLYDAA